MAGCYPSERLRSSLCYLRTAGSDGGTWSPRYLQDSSMVVLLDPISVADLGPSRDVFQISSGQLDARTKLSEIRYDSLEWTLPHADPLHVDDDVQHAELGNLLLEIWNLKDISVMSE